MARSKSKLDESLANAIRLEDLLHHAQYARSELSQDFKNILRPPQGDSSARCIPISQNKEPIIAFFINTPTAILFSNPDKSTRIQSLNLLTYFPHYYVILAIYLEDLPEGYLRYYKYKKEAINLGQEIGSHLWASSHVGGTEERCRSYIEYQATYTLHIHGRQDLSSSTDAGNLSNKDIDIEYAYAEVQFLPQLIVRVYISAHRMHVCTTI